MDRAPNHIQTGFDQVEARKLFLDEETISSFVVSLHMNAISTAMRYAKLANREFITFRDIRHGYMYSIVNVNEVIQDMPMVSSILEERDTDYVPPEESESEMSDDDEIMSSSDDDDSDSEEDYSELYELFEDDDMEIKSDDLYTPVVYENLSEEDSSFVLELNYIVSAWDTEELRLSSMSRTLKNIFPIEFLLQLESNNTE